MFGKAVMKKRIWVTWEVQRRNKTLSKALDAKYIEIISRRGRLLRYLFNTYKTLQVFIREKADVIFVQNPSILLSLVAVVYGKLAKITVIVDAHNAGLFPAEGRHSILNRVCKFIFNRAALTIVSNEFLAKYITENGGNSFVLQDPLPELSGNSNYLKEMPPGFKVVFVCSWANDEPYENVIKAALLLGKEITVYMTGDSKGRENGVVEKIPRNIIMTGYIDDNKYISLISSCDLLMVLTDRDHCLVCGAYEGVSLEKPLLLSNKEVLRSYFNKGVVYTDNTSGDIAKKIIYAANKIELLRDEIASMKKTICVNWPQKLTVLNTKIEVLMP